ncbi:MAG: hypothetical protein ACKO3K_06710 [Cuspidothrix sp.]
MTIKISEISNYINYEIPEIQNKKRRFCQAVLEVNYIDFIIRLSPVIEDLSVVQITDGSSVNWEFHKPEKCALGIVGMKD